MTLFRTRGFDTLIGQGTTIHGEIMLAPNSTTVIDGSAYLNRVIELPVDGKTGDKTTLRVSGNLEPEFQKELNIEVHNVIITGKVVCKTIRVEGTLAVKAGATLKAEKILYRNYVSETGAIILGNLAHLDYVSEGETV